MTFTQLPYVDTTVQSPDGLIDFWKTPNGTTYSMPALYRNHVQQIVDAACGAGHCNERAIQDRCAQIPSYAAIPSRQYDGTKGTS